MLVVQPVAPQLPWWSFPGREELLVLEAHHVVFEKQIDKFFLQCSFTTPGFDFDGGKGIRHRCFRIIGQRLHRIHIRSDALAGQWLLLT